MAGKAAVIICAAGQSSRFGGKRKKPFVDVAGRAAFIRSVEFFDNRDDVVQILLGIDSQDDEIVKVKWGANLQFFGVKVFHGGEERFSTVAKGLELIRDDIELVAVHDAVRCCLMKDWLDECFKKAAESGAAMLACPVVATLKDVDNGTIIKTVERAGLYEAQTPQIFKTDILKRAYENLKNLDETKISDDAQLVEALGEKVSIVETDASNIKITRKSDVPIADAIIKNRPKPKPKGYVGPYGEANW